jgi:hypothetical protein
MDLPSLNRISKFPALVPFQLESEMELNRKDLENFPISPTVISTPRYDKRFEGYDFLKSDGLLKFWADQIFLIWTDDDPAKLRQLNTV